VFFGFHLEVLRDERFDYLALYVVSETLTNYGDRDLAAPETRDARETRVFLHDRAGLGRNYIGGNLNLDFPNASIFCFCGVQSLTCLD
jgi:hypothetical protein